MLSTVFYGATSLAIVSLVMTMAVACGFFYGMHLLGESDDIKT